MERGSDCAGAAEGFFRLDGGELEPDADLLGMVSELWKRYRQVCRVFIPEAVLVCKSELVVD